MVLRGNTECTRSEKEKKKFGSAIHSITVVGSLGLSEYLRCQLTRPEHLHVFGHRTWDVTRRDLPQVARKRQAGRCTGLHWGKDGTGQMKRKKPVRVPKG